MLSPRLPPTRATRAAPLPLALNEADVPTIGAPVEGAWLLPQPEPQLLAVHLQKICQGDVLKVGAGAEQLVYGGARTNVDEAVS